MSRLSRLRRRFIRPLWMETLEDRSTPALAYGITGGNSLISFDTATPTAVVSTPITTLGANETIRGIDFRPLTGQLYALGITDPGAADNEGRIYTLDTATGKLTQVGSTPFASDLTDGANYGFDFNPASGGLRVVNDADQNRRVNPNTGVQVMADGNITVTSEIVAVGYDRDFNGTTVTTLFGIDAATDKLVTVGSMNGAPNSPDTGIVTDIGLLGITLTNNESGFDTAFTNGADSAFLSATVGAATNLYTVNLTTGTATIVQAIGSGLVPVASLAVLPNMLVGTAGKDVITIAANPFAADTVLVSLNGIVRGAFSNTAAAPLTILAGDSDDTITIGPGVALLGATINGEGGNDTISYTNVTTPVAVSLGAEHLFSSTLNAAQEVPPTTSTATGTAFVIFNNGTGLFDIRIDVTGITLAQLTASHLHAGTPGVNGAIFFDLGDSSVWTQSGPNTISRTVNGATFPAANIADLLAGNVYINVHTTANPTGEIRGQVNLAAAPGTGSAGATLTSIENATGGRSDDIILGDANINLLRGGAGNDTLLGRGGADALTGEYGNDLLIGGTGGDLMIGGVSTNFLVGLDAAGTSLLLFNITTPGTVETTTLFGLPTGKNLLGIDFRPATGQLFGFGLGNQGQAQVYTIDMDTGAVSLVGAGQTTPPFTVNGTSFGFDFNPTVDRIRITNDQEQNFRMNPETGTVVDGNGAMAGVQGDTNLTPGTLGGSAYTNNVAGATTTTLFGIDAGTDMLVRQGLPDPNDGVSTAVGPLGVDVDAVLGFDIGTDGTAYATFTVAATTGLYRINLTTGAATPLGNIGTGAGVVSGLAIVLAGATDDDRIVWNNGDGTDVIDGGDGNDTVEVNGSDGATGDMFTISANGTRVDFDRTNFGLFSLDIGTTENLVINGGLGDDSIVVNDLTGVTGVTSLTLSGGVGKDTINASTLPTGIVTTVTILGGNDDDTLTGSFGIDLLDGGAGNDLIVGGKGNDSFVGGAGDDTLVWNNGDGSDLMDGGVGNDTVQVNGSTTAGDAFQISANSTTSTLTFQRTNLVPFTLTITTSEAITVNGSGGDDSFNVQSSLASFPIALNGGADNDSFSLDSNGTATAGGTSENVISPVTIDGGDGTDSFTLEDSDDTTGDTVTVGAGTITGAGGPVNFSKIESATLNLGTGADTVNLTPQVGITFNINGNTPTGPTNKDTLNLTLAGITGTVGTSTTAGAGKFTFTNAGDVNFTGIETTTPAITTPPVVIPPVVIPPVVIPPVVIPPTPGTPGSFKLSTDYTVGSGPGGGTFSVIDGQTGAIIRTITPFPGFTGGIRTATGDVNNDGTPDTVAGTGPGIANAIAIFDGKTGNEIARMTVFEASFTGGVYVAVGDVNGDGFADIAISPDLSGGPRVKVLSGNGMSQIDDFFGIEGDTNFRGGVRVAIADIDNDGFGDILVAAGFGGGPRLAIYSGKTLGQHAPGGSPPKIVQDFFVFEQTLRNGVFVAAGDLDGDGNGDIIAGGGPGGGPRIFAVSGKDMIAGKTTQLANFFAGNSDNRSGVTVTAKDLDGDTRADLVVGDGSSTAVNSFLGKNIPTDGNPSASSALTGLMGVANGVNVG